jgi:hypothetical protein
LVWEDLGSIPAIIKSFSYRNLVWSFMFWWNWTLREMVLVFKIIWYLCFNVEWERGSKRSKREIVWEKKREKGCRSLRKYKDFSRVQNTTTWNKFGPSDYVKKIFMLKNSIRNFTLVSIILLLNMSPNKEIILCWSM